MDTSEISSYNIRTNSRITFPLITNETRRLQTSGHKESISKYPLKLHFLNTALYNSKLKVNVRGVGTHPSP